MIAPLVFGLGAIFFYLEARIGVLIRLENGDESRGSCGFKSCRFRTWIVNWSGISSVC